MEAAELLYTKNYTICILKYTRFSTRKQLALLFNISLSCFTLVIEVYHTANPPGHSVDSKYHRALLGNKSGSIAGQGSFNLAN